MIEEKGKNNKTGGIILIFLLMFLQSTYCFHWLLIPNSVMLIPFKIEILILLLYVSCNLSFVRSINRRTVSGWFIVFFFICSLISTIPCYLYHGQQFVDTLNAMLYFYAIFFYYVFFKYDVSPKSVAILFVFFALCKFAILLIQQFTYPVFWFNGYNEDDTTNYGGTYLVEIRSGIYRYLIGMIYIAYFAGFYLFCLFLSKGKNKRIYLLLFVLIIIGIYLEQFRYNMACFLFCWLWMNTKHNKSSKSKKPIILAIIALALLYLNYDRLFGELSDMAERDMDEDYIRILDYQFFGLEYWKGPMTVFFGNGFPSITGGYHDEIQYYFHNFTLVREDCGIVGSINIFGIFLLFVLVMYIVKIYKNWKYIYIPYQAYLLWLLLMLPLYFPVFYTGDTSLFMAGFMYIMDKSIIDNHAKFAKLNYE